MSRNWRLKLLRVVHMVLTEVAGNREKKLAKEKECSVAELLVTGAGNRGGGARATFP